MSSIDYKPPATVRDFIRDFIPGALFDDWIVGPVGSGKTTGIFMKLVYMAGLQDRGPDGYRRSRAVIVRNTSTQLRDTTLASWFTWFKPGIAGDWKETPKVFILRFGDVICEVLFRPLDTPDDISRVLSLEVTFAVLDEFVEIPKAIVEALSARCGRYPSKIDGGATNWGMWGASNTTSEDNWWYEHLHATGRVIQPGETFSKLDRMQQQARGTRYFLQPSGFSSLAENIENLPGGRGYYENLAKNRSETWIRQFIEVLWGFSVAGKPVVQTFNRNTHLSKLTLAYEPALPLIAGFDPGLGGAAMVFGQLDYDGQLRVLGEIVTAGVGTKQFIVSKLEPYLSRRFPELNRSKFIIAPDPASANRSSNDEGAIVKTLKEFYPVAIETNNRLPLRLDAIDHYATRITMGKPGLLIDEGHCPVLVRALKGGWRYKLDKNEQVASPAPEKNASSHPGDSFGYLCRYFHKGTIRAEQAGSIQVKRKPINAYHFT